MLSGESATPSPELKSVAPACIYRFGVVEVDFHAGELRKAGLRVRLQDQPLRVLSILLRHPGETVSRDEFRRSLWSAGTFVDFDHGLNSAVKRLREALDDDHDRPRFVETIPRHGYRFIAPITKTTIPMRHDAIADLSRAESTPPQINPKTAAPVEYLRTDNIEPHLEKQSLPWRPWFIPIAIGTLLVVSTAIVLIVRRAYAHRHSGSQPKIVLAVLPFRDLTAKPSQRFVTEGLMQALITRLGKLNPEQIVVSARTPLNRNQDSKASPSDIGSDLGAGYVLVGSAQLQGNHLRVSVQLINTRDQRYVWAESYDETSNDILQDQAYVATRISDAVGRQLTH
jgi:TolB-like protein/DNA-binding winged helix-turn-helix (wHTH) protein